MSSRRSKRSKRTINYSKLEREASDDDFEINGHPAMKKATKTKNKNVTSSPKISKSEEASQKKSKSRNCDVRDKKFEEEMELALKLSLSASNNTDSSSESGTNDFLCVSTKAQVCPSQKPGVIRQNMNSKICLRKDGGVICEVQDEIKPVSEEESYHATKRDEDGEYEASEESDHDDSFGDDYEDEDEDVFKVKKKVASKRNGKKSASKRENISVPCKDRTNTQSCNEKLTSKCRKIKASDSIKCNSVNPVSAASSKSNNLSSTNTKPQFSIQKSPTFSQPNWKPPGSAGQPSRAQPASIASPRHLRIGLSRNVRLKPLHTGLKRV